MRGLEIGPLAFPRVRKEEGDVLYVDHTDAEGLRSKYADNPIMQEHLDQIVDLDFVIGDSQGIHEAVADQAPFDYVMASHLIEHIPDPVTWLLDIAKILRPGGILSLIIPDKRFTFDINRRTTEIGDLVDAYLRGLRTPSFRQAYDFISKELTQKVDPVAVWAGAEDYVGLLRSDVPDPDVAALQLCRTIERTNEYVDVHCSVFTPESFLELYEKLVRIGLIDFEVAHFIPTELNDLEFHVSLRRVDPALDRDSIVERQLASVPSMGQSKGEGLPEVDAPPSTSVLADTPLMPPKSVMMEVSDRERMFITAKRRVLEKMRTLLR
jgi:SAM-dependent methyltransferase